MTSEKRGLQSSLFGNDGSRSNTNTTAGGFVQSSSIDQMLFPSSGGFLDANQDPLTDDSLIAVWAESTAVINDRDGNGDAVDYPDDVDIPIVCVDERNGGAVAGVGAQLVNDGDLVPELEGEDPLGDIGNEEFLLNLYDEYVGGGTVLWDEGHGQFYDLGSFQNFEAYAEDNGYTLQTTTDVEADLSNADAVVITSPGDAFTDAEKTALSNFVDNGGLVVMHTQSDFSNFDETGNFNDLAAGLGIDFRFNDAEVADEESNVGTSFLPLTSNFNTAEFALFQDRPGITIDLQAGEEYEVAVASVADGDTCDVVFSASDVGLETDYTGTVRMLGIDTPESASVAQFAERPEEWEGLAYDLGVIDEIDEFVFDSTASLLDASQNPLTDDSLVAIYAESTAENQDADSNGDAVSYPSDTDIPLVAIDGNVVGLGAPFITDDELDATADNEEFMLNVYDSVVGGGTVLWDVGHGQFYDLSSASEFEAYAESEGYDLQATSDIESDLSTADAVVITSPGSFTSSELTALSDFVANGGAVILHDQADFNDFDNTASLNAIADELGVGFRFNDDQVIDNDNNTGQSFVPTTGNFDSTSPLFEKRAGIDDDPDARTNDYLTTWASNASTFADNALNGATVTLSFDANEPLRDPTRLLAYLEYDDSGDGNRDTLYNKAAIEQGYARAYGSSLSRHDEFWAAEDQARTQGTGIWGQSDLADASPYRERPPEELFFPAGASIDVASGSTVDLTVYAESNADQTETNNTIDGQIPLLGSDSTNRTVVAGSLLIDEAYERLEGFDVDTAGYDNFAFLTNIIESLTDQSGPVYVDGGHGQFGVDYALSSEDMAYYQRHLEGRQLDLEQINDLTLDRLSDARALIITTPASALTSAELDAVTSFRDNGGAVVLMGSADAPDSAVQNLNDIADALGTGLEANTDRVIDDSNNVAGDPEIPTTTLASDVAIQAQNSVTVPPRTLLLDDDADDRLRGGEFALDSIKTVTPGETVEVNVGAPGFQRYQIEIRDSDLHLVDAGQPDQTGDVTETFDTTGIDPGTYLIAPVTEGEALAIQPLIVEGYDAEITAAPDQLTTADTLTVEASVTEAVSNPPALEDVTLLGFTDSNETGLITTMEESDGSYVATVSELPADEYQLHVAPRSQDNVSFEIQSLTVESETTAGETSSLDDAQTQTLISGSSGEPLGLSEGPDRNGDTVVVDLADSDELAQVWSQQTVSGSLQFSRPAVDNENIYVGGLDDSVTAQARNSGELRWTVQRVGSLSDSSPVLYDGTLYIGDGGGLLHAIDPSEGSLNWSYDTAAETGSGSAVTSTPAVFDDGSNVWVFFASNDGLVHAVIDDGSAFTTQWTQDVGAAVYSDLDVGVALGVPWLFVTTTDGRIVVHDVLGDQSSEQGQAIADIDAPADSFGSSSPLFDDGTLYLAGDIFHAVDVEATIDTGSPTFAWQQTEYGGSAGSNPVVAGSGVYVGGADGQIYAMNASDGALVWQLNEDSGPEEAVAATPAVAGDRLVAGSLDQTVYVVDRYTGTVTGKRTLSDPIRSGPVVRNGNVYVGTDAGTVVNLENLP